MTRLEFKFLKKILRDYYQHVIKNPKTQIIKFYGLHKIELKKNKTNKAKKFYFLIMENIFNATQEIHVRYDIKGSTYQRNTKETLLAATRYL